MNNAKGLDGLENAFCSIIAKSIEKGDNDCFDKLISTATDCNDAEWYTEHLSHINYVLSETLEYAGALLRFGANDETITVDTCSKTVVYRFDKEFISIPYSNDGLGIDNYCKERYQETK